MTGVQTCALPICNKVLFVKEFLCQPNTSTDKIVALAKNLESLMPDPVLSRWVDCPGQLQVDLRQSHGFDVRLPIKDDWQAGINNMQIRFARGEIEVHPDCKFLIQSLESGQYNKNRTDFSRSDVLGHCDALAACGYGLRMIDMSMPYDLPNLPKTRYLQVSTVKTEQEQLSDMIIPKSFVQSRKKFGAFKR